jgi:phage terminase small subunit
MPIQPMTDSERVLGQIERGEIRAGADAAREVAARHQAAYGDAVWPSFDDVLTSVLEEKKASSS